MTNNEIVMELDRSGPLELAGGGGVLLRNSVTAVVFPPWNIPARRRTITLLAASCSEVGES